MPDSLECSHPANGLLPWYVNGSLEGDEEALVREHVRDCAVCSQEIDVLSTLSRGLRTQDPGVPALSAESDMGAFESGQRAGRKAGLGVPPGARVPAQIARALAAGLAVPAALGLWWMLLGFPGVWSEGREPDHLPQLVGRRLHATRPLVQERPLGALQSAVEWELPSPRRGGESPGAGFLLPAGAETIALRVSLPINPDVRYTIELSGPAGTILRRGALTPVLDPLGRSTFVLHADELRTAGAYEIIAREERPAGEPAREFRYPFRVEVSAPSAP